MAVEDTAFIRARETKASRYILLFNMAFSYRENDLGGITIHASDEDMEFFGNMRDYHPYPTPRGAHVNIVMPTYRHNNPVQDFLRPVARKVLV